MKPTDLIASLPDDTEVYVPGIGVSTIGQIRATKPEPLDERQATRAMWAYIATNPREKPWRSGRIRVVEKVLAGSGSTNDPTHAASTWSGTTTRRGSNAA